MSSTHSLSWLEWPFLDHTHRELAIRLRDWCGERELPSEDVSPEQACREWVAALGAAGWLRYSVPAGPDGAYGGALDELDSRSLCILRETLAGHHALADFAFAMQGLGSGAISLAGSDAQKRAYLPAVARGEKIAAFALSEPEAGSDVAALSCAAVKEGDEYVLNGEKTWISNGGIADFYCVFVRTDPDAGARGVSAFIVDTDTPGLEIAEMIDVISPHPLATLRFTNCRVPANQMLGGLNQGFKLAMQTLDVFRTSVAAAAVGFARKALDAALHHAASRRMFGGTLADMQLTQAALGDAATDIDQSALLTYRAAWVRDVQKRPPTIETAMAKMAATESAQRVIDRMQQMFGGLGVKRNHPLEQLYRDIRALRIYEGATEVQKLIISRGLLKSLS
ncbi:acyl-CoA dehydrogenase family protein [Bordetella sp. 02P26C-1]|uniref:acyl-CoA dehydrogenase family protein n=1 Tax=Bordetella sp. 02P26C-1 TaxID=2683195 RepID=UPI001354C61D|nr:acyl-CoA dehydrogenase family protein [Bordetella sp. 02P26C-1]MVW80037.1 acyl-CoA dehydrogenase [Bordetella sp. 02P26C-1]